MRSDNAPPFVARFEGRRPAPGAAYLVKDSFGTRLKLVNPRPSVLGVDEGKMCATFVVSTDDPDRVDDVVTTKGISLANFKYNPIAFYNHQAHIWPVGKWATRDADRCTVKVEEHRATATCYFSQRDPDAARAFDLVVEGILRATSIGFNPIEEPRPREGRKANPISLQQGFVFPKVDLLEISIVGIPCQPTATLVREYLGSRKAAGLTQSFRKSLELLCEPAPAWANGFTPEADVSKKWGKTVSKHKQPRPKKHLPAGTVAKLLEMIPDEHKDAVQECVSAKMPTLLEEGYDRDQALAIAFATCREGKALGGGGGTAGGYTVPPSGKSSPGGYTADRTSEITKGPPPVAPQTPDQQQPPPQQQQQQMPQMMPQNNGGDPKEVLNRLVDALTDYLDLTGASAAPEMGGDVEEGDESSPTGEGVNDDFEDFESAENGETIEDPDEEEDDEEERRLQRYQRYGASPRRVKAGRYYKADLMKRCKEGMAGAADHLDELGNLEEGKYGKAHRTASMAHGKALRQALADLDGEADESGADAGEGAPGEPEEMKAVAAEIDRRDGLDLDRVMARLEPLERRAGEIEQQWQSLSGRMP